MSIDVGSGWQDTSGFGKSIRKFRSIRDSFDKVVKILELLQAADLLYEDDREFLDTKLDDLKVRAEEIRIENLMKPKYTPPPTKISSDKADNMSMSCYLNSSDALDSKAEKMEELQRAIESIYSSSPELDAAVAGIDDDFNNHWWLDLKPGDVVYCIDKQHNYHTLSIIRNDGYEMSLRDNLSGVYSLWRQRYIMLHLAPSQRQLRRKLPCDMSFL